MSRPFTPREWVVIALYEARHYVSKVSEATLHEDNDLADFELLEIIETAIEGLGAALTGDQSGKGGVSC